MRATKTFKTYVSCSPYPMSIWEMLTTHIFLNRNKGFNNSTKINGRNAPVHTVIVQWIKQSNNLYGNYYKIAFKCLIKMA